MQEIWKDIRGYEGLYMVSNTGRVMSFHCTPKATKKSGIHNGRIMKSTLSSSGYWHVQLYKSQNKVKTILVHILVARAFIPNPDNLPEVNHIDGNKANNNVVNLEWVTRSENAQHAIKTGLRKPSPMSGIKGAKNPNSKEILQYSLDGEYLRTWCGIAEASRVVGCSYCTISACLTGRKRTAKGYVWRYKTSSNPPLTISIPERIHPNKRTWKQKNKRNMRKIQQLTINGELVKTWLNYIELTKSTGYDNGNIYKCINGKAKTAYGYIWRYKE